LKAVPDPFHEEERLTRAILAAPLAGIAAGALHILRATKEDSHEDK
jgi:hypothetical protein